MPPKYSSKELDLALESVLSLCEKNQKNDNKFYTEFNKIIYNNNEDYVHFYPHSLTIKLTSDCNLRCNHCFFYGKPENYSTKGDLPPQKMYQYIKDLVEEAYIMQCTITGGEIFTSPIAKDVIELLKSKNIALTIITNGTLITKELALWLSQKLNPKYDHIQISIEGANSEVCDAIRGKGVFDKVINAIKCLTELNVIVYAGFTVNSLNVHQIADLYNICKELNVSKLVMGRFLLSSPEQEYLVPEQDDIFINLAKLSELYDEHTQLEINCVKTPHFLEYESGIRLFDKKLQENPGLPKTLHCAPHHEAAALFPNGDVSLCYCTAFEPCIIGNMSKNSFKEIWQSRYKCPIFEKRLISDSFCKDCKYLCFCLSGCLCEAYKRHGTINGMAFDCKYYKNFLRNKND